MNLKGKRKRDKFLLLKSRPNGELLPSNLNYSKRNKEPESLIEAEQERLLRFNLGKFY